MRNKNTKGKIEYILTNIFWTGIAMIWYTNYLFRYIPGCTLVVSEIVMWGLLIVFNIFGIILTYNNRRNGLSILVNIITPIEIYTLICFFKDLKVFAAISVSLSLSLTFGYFFLILSQKIHNKKRKKQIIRRRIKFGLLGSRTIVACCMLLFIIPLGMNTIFGKTMAFKNTAADVPNSENECSIANNIDIVSNLIQEKWSTLNINEKANTLQTVSNIECWYLGLPHELNLKIDTLQKSTIAQYNDKTHTITVNVLFLDSSDAQEMLNSICHEAFHAYQHRLCDAYYSVDPKYKTLIAFCDVPSYEKEFENYIDGKSDFFGYFSQNCESQARKYASESVIDYYEKIEFYNNHNAD